MLGLFAGMYGFPTALLIWAASLAWKRSWSRTVRRAALQAFVIGVLSMTLPFLGMWVEGVSNRVTQKRGNAIAEKLDSHRSAHGRYPATLDALGPLPHPTFRRDFSYDPAPDGRSYQLSYSGGGFVDVWVRSADSKQWIRD
jgi:hypothetical protein